MDGRRKKIFWDIETSDLNANWGSIYCIGYQVEGERVRCISVTDFPGWERRPWDDAAVIASFLKVLNREDVGTEITHYGTLFDIPFLKARMLHNRLGTFPILGHVDTYFVAKSNFKMKSRSLKSVAAHSGCRYKKTELDPEIWRRAGRADRDALDYIVKHCVADIRVLREVYGKISPFMRQHPVINDYGACHVCGKKQLQRRGFATTVKSGKKLRYQCQNCGAWTTRLEGGKKK